jgi:collagenase-like PrtC family protease
LAAGKEVVLSSLVLLEAESEMNAMRSLCENGRVAIEANDIGVAYMAAELGCRLWRAYTLNIYNTRTLATWARRGHDALVAALRVVSRRHQRHS